MSASDVMMAYGQRCHPLGVANTAGLEKRGVPREVLEFDEGRKLFKVMKATVRKEAGFFEFVDAGSAAIIFVCRDERGDVADLAAWTPAEDDIALWLGNVSMLGEEAVLRARLAGDKLWVHPTPLDWLIHRRTGVVILNHDRARPLLVAGSPIAVKTKTYARWLEEQWQAPRITVFDDGGAAAVTEAA